MDKKICFGMEAVTAEPVWLITPPRGGVYVQDKSCDTPLPLGSEVEDGYRVYSRDGLVKFVPKCAFEFWYRRKDMSFSLALEAMKKGQRVARAGWSCWGAYAFLADDVEFHTDADLKELETPGEEGVFTGGMLVLRTDRRTLIPGWTPDQEDLLAEDWHVVE